MTNNGERSQTPLFFYAQAGLVDCCKRNWAHIQVSARVSVSVFMNAVTHALRVVQLLLPALQAYLETDPRNVTSFSCIQPPPTFFHFLHSSAIIPSRYYEQVMNPATAAASAMLPAEPDFQTDDTILRL